MPKSPAPLFSETQRFRQRWLWIGYGAVFLVVLASFVYVAAVGAGAGFRFWAGALFAFVVLGGVGWLLWVSRLETRVDADGLHTRFYPLERTERTLIWNDMTGWQIATLRPLRDHGGRGLRIGRGGKAYIVTGTKSVNILMKNGKTLFVGTTRPEELAVALERGKGDIATSNRRSPSHHA